MRDIPLKHLKQYTSYEFAHLLNDDQVQKVIQLPSFSPNIDCLQKDLKLQIIDRNENNGQQVLYILRFSKGSSLVSLNFFQLYSQKKYQINMSQKPLFVEIVNQFMYIGGGSQLFIINLQDLTIKNTFGLGSDIIHAIQPGYRQFGTQEKGIYIYSWNDKRGFQKRFFSDSNYLVSPWWENFISYIRPNKQHAGLRNSVLKVVISNVLGIIFTDKKTLYLVDLEKMKIIYNCMVQLNWEITNLQKTIIRYYINEKLLNQDDDCLVIAIGQKDKEAIEVLVLSITYKQSVREKIKLKKIQSIESGYVGLPCIYSGDMVDWDRSTIQPYLHFNNDGLGLIDFILTENSILFVYSSGQKLPESGFINYQSPLVTHPILPLQHNIFSSFFQDLQVYDKLSNSRSTTQRERQMIKLKNSILAPNRYSKQFLQVYFQKSLNQGLKEMSKQGLNPKKIFFDWLKQHSIRVFVKFDRDLLLIRQKSVTTFLPIKKQQFIYEYYDRKKIREYYDNDNRDRSSVSSLQSYRYEDPISIRISNMTPIQQFSLRDSNGGCFNYERKNCHNIIEKNNLSPQKEYELRKRQIIKQKHQSFWNQFIENMKKYCQPETQNIYEQRNILIKSHNLISALLPNRIFDMIQFYHRIFKQLFSTTKYIFIDIKQEFIREEKITINYLDFLNQIIFKPLQQIKAQGNDLLSIFIDQELAKIKKMVSLQLNNRGNSSYYSIYNNIGAESWRVFTKLFEGITFDTKETEINPFINKILEQIKEGCEYLIQILRKPFYPSQIKNVEYYSDQQNHFHYNATTLNILSILPLQEAHKMQVITAFVTNLSCKKSSTKILNTILQKSPYIKLQAKKKIKQLYKGLFLRQQLKEDQDEMSQMMKLNGLVELTKIYEGQILQQQLLKESLQEINRRFRFDQQTYLQYYQSRDLGLIKFTNQELLSSEVFKYRIYIQKLKQYFKQILKPNQEIKQVRYQLQLLVKNSIKALKQAQLYYPQLSKRNRKRNNAVNAIDDENFINKVCCSLVGFNDNQQLLLYEEEEKGKILPELSFLALLQRIIKDQKSSLDETVCKFSSVMNYAVAKFLENPLIQDFLLKIIAKYLSSDELSQIIQNSDDLRQQYFRIMNQTEDMKKLRQHFPHLKIKGLQLDRISQQVKEGKKPNQLGHFDEENTSIPFRNLYLEGIRK